VDAQNLKVALSF